MKVAALLTGRGQNTLKDKNILSVNGKPVLYYPAYAAKKATRIDDFYVSSDDEKILSAAQELGYSKIVRPPELARPDSQHIDAIQHALAFMASMNASPDILVCLMANNVTISAKWIDECIALLQTNTSITSAVPVYRESDHHPLRAKKMDSSGILSSFVETKGTKVSTNRQDLEPCYFLSHNFWVMRVADSIAKNDGENPWTFLGKTVKGYLVDESIDIHKKIDLLIAENWIQHNWEE